RQGAAFPQQPPRPRGVARLAPQGQAQGAPRPLEGGGGVTAIVKAPVRPHALNGLMLRRPPTAAVSRHEAAIRAAPILRDARTGARSCCAFAVRAPQDEDGARFRWSRYPTH